MMKKSFLILCGVNILATLAYAQYQDVSDDTMQELVNSITATTPRGVKGITTSLENPNYKQQSWCVSVTAAAWTAKMDGTVTGTVFDTLDFTPVAYSFEYSYPNFQWDFSVKGVLSYYFDHDGWALSLGYNYFHTKGRQNISFSSQNATQTLPCIIPTHSEVFNITTPSLLSNDYKANLATVGDVSLNLVLNDASLRMGRSFFLAKSLSIDPNVGIQSTWFSTHAIARFSGGGVFYQISDSGFPVYLAGLGDTTAVVDNRFKFYAIGPRVGLDAKCYINKCFNVYANVTGAALFAYYKHRLQETYDFYPSNLILAKEKPSRVIPYTDLEIGLGYDKDFNKLRQHLALQVGFEFKNFHEASLYTGPYPGAISMYGANFNLSFGF